MADIDPQLRRAKEAAETDLLSRPGVTGVDIGYKEVGGKPTDQLAIRVLVEKKRREVPAAQRVPAEIGGFPTDVIERKFELHVAQKTLDQVTLQVDTGTYDPLKGGISIGPCRAVGGFIYAGTMGLMVTDNATSQQMLLSNFHVMCIDNTWAVGDTMAQPSRIDGGSCPGSVVGALQRAVLGSEVDCAVASHTARGIVCEIAEIGAVNGTGTPTVGQAVRKRGRTTGLTYGTVDTVDLSVNIDYGDGIGMRTLVHQIGVRPDTTRNPKFSDHGDSGAVIVSDTVQVLGLNFAGDSTGYGISNPIAAVLTALNVSVCRQRIKVWKEFMPKELIKEWIKERKEFKVEIKDFKEIKPELEKVIVDVPKLKDGEGGWPPQGPPIVGGPGGPGGPGAPADEATWLHFISQAERPDLSLGALQLEPDLGAAPSIKYKELAKEKDLPKEKDKDLPKEKEYFKDRKDSKDHKDLKNEGKDQKDVKNEGKEQKDVKDKQEKNETKEHKDFKDFKERKDVTDKSRIKDFAKEKEVPPEHQPFGAASPADPSGGGSSASAYTDLIQQLQQQAEQAKSAKDGKDAEKLRES